MPIAAKGSVVGKRAALLLALVLAAPLLLADVDAARAEHSHRMGYHWARTTNPVVIRAGSDVTLDSRLYVEQAASDWSKSTVLDVVVAAGSGQEDCPFVPGQVTVCNGSYGETGWLGLASFVVDRSGHITAARAQVNDSYANALVPVYRQFLFCHEIGHTLGLGHDSGHPDSCMNTEGDETGISPVPGAHDYEELEAIYAHLDTAKVEPAHGAKTSRPGRSERAKVVDLPGGEKLVTISTDVR